MRPGAEQVLRETAKRLEAEVLPNMTVAYDAATVQFAAFIMSAVADHWDNAAAWRFEEGQALRSLFAHALNIVDETLRQEMQRLLAAPPAGLKISQLDAENDRLRALLVRIHAAMEVRNDEPARSLTREIVDELKKGADRRAFVTQPV